ncbi:hypothetical protein DUI87_17997 [Hirundo rustica rustica]|uniref:Uncharacterized protein n=1 Tax=Hirundo rustica rustica TaxID=333673 RepID=A0A3M0K0C0_HIRRU|nr:hypothetical protein DUI87_17997 [Hirundo rustica rustica]
MKTVAPWITVYRDLQASPAGKTGETDFLLHTAQFGISNRFASLGHFEKDGEQRERVQNKGKENEQRFRKSIWLD